MMSQRYGADVEIQTSVFCGRSCFPEQMHRGAFRLGVMNTDSELLTSDLQWISAVDSSCQLNTHIFQTLCNADSPKTCSQGSRMGKKLFYIYEVQQCVVGIPFTVWVCIIMAKCGPRDTHCSTKYNRSGFDQFSSSSVCLDSRDAPTAIFLADSDIWFFKLSFYIKIMYQRRAPSCEIL